MRKIRSIGIKSSNWLVCSLPPIGGQAGKADIPAPPPLPPIGGAQPTNKNQSAKPTGSTTESKARDALLEDIIKGKTLKKTAPSGNEGKKVEGDRNAILDDIKKGVQLKKVSQESKTEKKVSAKGANPRDELMKQIQEGVKLKKTSQNRSPAPTADPLKNALEEALAKRRDRIAPPPDNANNDNLSDDSEWD